MEDMDHLNVLTLNTWGLLYISKDLEERMNALADELAKGHYHLVHLQEVWSTRHYEVIRERVRKVLPYAHYFHSGLIGSGCATFSHFPIVDAFFHKYSHNGYFWDILHGDWFGGKGIGCCVIQHPKSNIYSFNTHLHADYPGGISSGLAECRMLQIYQLVQFLRHTTRPGDRIIVTGDLNHEPDSFGVKALCELAGLNDTYVVARVKPSECNTLDPVTNKYVAPDEIVSRIDFIFASKDFDCVNCNLAIQRIPNTDIHYSDHEGYTATLNMTDTVNTEETTTCNDEMDTLQHVHSAIRKGAKVCDEIKWRKVLTLLAAFLSLIAMPIFSVDAFHAVFPPVSTWTGKCVFVVQIVMAVFCVVYMWVVTYVRQADVKVFKSVCAEIEVRMRAIQVGDDRKTK